MIPVDGREKTKKMINSKRSGSGMIYTSGKAEVGFFVGKKDRFGSSPDERTDLVQVLDLAFRNFTPKHTI